MRGASITLPRQIYSPPEIRYIKVSVIQLSKLQICKQINYIGFLIPFLIHTLKPVKMIQQELKIPDYMQVNFLAFPWVSGQLLDLSSQLCRNLNGFAVGNVRPVD